MKVFISAFRTEHDLSSNRLRHAFLKRQVESLGLSYKTGLGCYEGSRELSLVVECKASDLKNLNKLAEFLEQDCIMVVNNIQVALMNQAKEFTVIGNTLVQVDETKALSTGNYSKIEGKFYIVA
jgi:hypothetical protein